MLQAFSFPRTQGGDSGIRGITCLQSLASIRTEAWIREYPCHCPDFMAAAMNHSVPIPLVAWLASL